ncbi:hypothetical protein CANCADRAFT_45792 [Tortispora caseinolytica NRRL Y-17796]|uniref:Uncharacterized protein n=1 Tax=Tortispora caseinolytica NRRL Y-17796 TaxID=767744 RepID=A0A1E4TC68_9ASCO|nr:hypothetical protein CANCADRAFT_45792 [Tortispora caseinolytica NRRL Y-17796]
MSTTTQRTISGVEPANTTTRSATIVSVSSMNRRACFEFADEEDEEETDDLTPSSGSFWLSSPNYLDIMTKHVQHPSSPPRSSEPAADSDYQSRFWQAELEAAQQRLRIRQRFETIVRSQSTVS